MRHTWTLSQATWPCSRLLSVRRPYLTGAPCRSLHTVPVPVGSSGKFNLDIFTPSQRTSSLGLLVYLPQGPLHFSSKDADEPLNLQKVADAAGSLTIRVNYRLSSKRGEKYPLPVHDVGSAWAWIQENIHSLLPYRHGIDVRRNIGVTGQFIGGSLAAMLALTSCHLGSGTAMTAAYLGNPIADWTMMRKSPAPEDGTSDTAGDASSSETKRKKTTRKKVVSIPSWEMHADNPVLSSRSLSLLKHSLFNNSQLLYDPFASPLLFFRTPAEPEPELGQEDREIHEAVQAATVEEGEKLEILPDSYLETLNELNQNHGPSAGSAESDRTTSGDEILLWASRKKKSSLQRYYRRWPPNRSGLGLPRVHLTVGTQSPLRDMSVELARDLNRSMRLLVAKSGRFNPAECDNYDDIYAMQDLMGAQNLHTQDSLSTSAPSGSSSLDNASDGSAPEQRATLQDVAGLGNWSESALMDMAAWFRQQWSRRA